MKPSLPMNVLQSLQGHLSVAQNFIFTLNISSEFAFLMSPRINSHILGASEDILSVPEYTVRFLRLCSSGSPPKLYGFCIKWKMFFIISSPKSFFVFQVSVTRICRFFYECSLICLFSISHQKREMIHIYRQILKLFHELC